MVRKNGLFYVWVEFNGFVEAAAAPDYGYQDYGLCGLCDYEPSQEVQIHAELYALDAAAERARAAVCPALDLAAESNAPATVAAAEPDGAPDEPEQRVAIAAAVPAEPGSAPVEPEHHAAANDNEPPPPWTALTVPNSRSRTRRLAHARALARAAVAAASRANTDASASRVARAPNAHARRGFFDAQDEADEQRRRGISFMFAIFGSPPPAPTSPREPRPRHPFFSWAVLWADSRGAG